MNRRIAATHALPDRGGIANVAADSLEPNIIDPVGAARFPEQTHDFAAAPSQQTYHRGSDESVASGDEDAHRPWRPLGAPRGRECVDDAVDLIGTVVRVH